MAYLAWNEGVKRLSSHVARIATPRGHGTGFLFSYAKAQGLCALATAAHVVDNAERWDEPIRIEKPELGQSLLLRPHERAILRRDAHDTAAVLFKPEKDMFPAEPTKLMAQTHGATVGSELGWLGFPSVAPDNLCFFSGMVSSRLEAQKAYLVDGVAINGVSGGPAFLRAPDDTLLLVGIVSAYRPNLSLGGTLPGLCVVRHVGELHDFVKSMQSLDQAKEEQKSNPSPPSTNSQEPGLDGDDGPPALSP